MAYKIEKSDFTNIFPIWRNHLWPERKEPIEATSALCFISGIDTQYKSAEVFFYSLQENSQIIAVCSGQKTSKDYWRSRGLWVTEEHRKKGIGKRLFLAVEQEIKKRGGKRLWTLARYTAKPFYNSMGMKNFGKTYQFEYGPHFWMSKDL